MQRNLEKKALSGRGQRLDLLCDESGPRVGMGASRELNPRTDGMEINTLRLMNPGERERGGEWVEKHRRESTSPAFCSKTLSTRADTEQDGSSGKRDGREERVECIDR